MTVIVLDGNTNQALACVRSIARAGYKVVVGAETRWSVAGLSRYAAASFAYPDPRDDLAACAAGVLSAVRTHGPATVLPMTDATTLALAREREPLAASGATLLLPSTVALETALDKLRVVDLAGELGVPCPQTTALASDDHSLCAQAEGLRYPVVLKPRRSIAIDGRSARVTGRPMYARSPAECVAAWRSMRARTDEVIAQEYVEGFGGGYFALVDRGRIVVEFAHRRLRDVHPSGSGSALRESAAVDPVHRAHAAALLAALGWHGVAMVELRERRDGTAVLMEVNGRFWQSLALAVHAGVDFPALAARLATGQEIGPQPLYRTGVRCRWLLGDLRHLLAVWAGAPRGFPGVYPSRLETTWRVLAGGRGVAEDYWDPRDPMPALGQWVHFFARTVPSRTRRATRGQHHDPAWSAARSQHVV